MTQRFTMTKLYGGCYRLSNGRVFSNIRKGRSNDGEQTSKWYADLRNSETGTLIRFAGIWNSRAAAADEVMWIMREWQ